MSAMGVARFREMLGHVLEKSRAREVTWTRDAVDRTMVVQLPENTRIGIYHHIPAGAQRVAGAALHQRGELVVTLEAEEGGRDWALLAGLHESASRSLEGEGDRWQRLEEQLTSDEPIGQNEDPGGSKLEVDADRSLRDFEDGDSPFDERR